MGFAVSREEVAGPGVLADAHSLACAVSRGSARSGKACDARNLQPRRARDEGDTLRKEGMVPRHPPLAKSRCLALLNNLAPLRWLDLGNHIREPRSVNSGSATSVDRPKPAAALAPEWDLVLAASCADPRESDLGRIRSLLNPRAGEAGRVEAVFRLADRHGTSSLLYQNLSRFGGIVPPSELAPARQSYERNVHESLFRAREMIRIPDRLDAMGIEAIP